MIIVPIDKENRLFAVTEVLPLELVNQILQLDWENLPWVEQPQQEHWKRRNIDFLQVPELININKYIENLCTEVELACFIEFTNNQYITTRWWYDLPGFTVPIHTDGQLPSTMQLFWEGTDITKGPKFYNSKRETDIKYDFPFNTNTGYLMLNGANNDGSYPLQWHGMMNAVAPGTYRLTSYTIFNSYTAK